MAINFSNWLLERVVLRDNGEENEASLMEADSVLLQVSCAELGFESSAIKGEY